MIMNIYRSLNLPASGKYYLLENDRKTCPEVLRKFKNYLDSFLKKEFLGYIDLIDENVSVEENANIIVVSNYLNYLHSKLMNKCSFVVLWDDRCWGKLEIFNVMQERGLFEAKFNLDNFRKMIGAVIGKNHHGQKEIGPYIISRMIPYSSFLNKLPMLFKKEANYHEGQIYGHPLGYAKNLIKFDINFRRKVSTITQQLSDQKSKDLLKLIIYGKPQDIWKYYFDNIQNYPQYLSYISLEKDSVIINCGVEEGAELPAFLSMDCKRIYNVDPSGSSKLGAYAKLWHSEHEDRMEYIEKWLYTKAEGIDANKPVTSLREIINDYNISQIDFIKSDVEGAERIMVNDLVDIVNQHRPQLAISIYHTQHDDNTKSPLSDIVEIPLKLMKHAKNYNFYINFYSFERWEIVLYCIPKEKDRNAK